MTIRGFLGWYLTIVALVCASGAGAWHGIQSHRHLETAAVVPAVPSETSPPSPQVADAEPMRLAAAPDQIEVTQPTVRPQSNAAPLPLPPLHAPMPIHSATQTAPVATPPWIAGPRPRAARKVATRGSTHRYPQTVVARRPDVYPYDALGSYAGAYPPAPWRVSHYAYYYPPYGYYPRYSYYYYPPD
jgi:hypothetical protein